MTSNPEDRDRLDLESAKAKDKRPHALIDLEATEVPTPGPEAAEPDRAASGASDGGAAEPAAEAGSERVETQAASGASDEVADDRAEDARTATSETAPDREEAVKPYGAFSAWPFAGALTHVVAGVAGGALALMLFTALTPRSARRAEVAQAPADLGAVERRLDAIERANASGTMIESRLAKAEQAQSGLAEEMRALAEKVGQHDPAALAARVAKLEEDLAALSAPAPAGAPQASARQLSSLTSKLADIEARLAKPGDGGEALKPEVARLDQSIAAVKADADKNAATAVAAQEAANALRGALDALSSKVDQQFQATAKSGDIPAAVGPLSARLAAQEQTLDGVVKTEATRRDGASRILLSLELATLKRAIERGQGYGAELAEVRETSAGRLDLAVLDKWSERGAPTLAELSRDFRSLMPSVLDAGRGAEPESVLDRIVAGARSVVRVRKLDHEPGDASVDAVASRMEAALVEGRLGEAIGEANKLPPPARSVLGPWLSKAEARDAVDAALAAVEGQLKASLTEAGASPPPPQ